MIQLCRHILRNNRQCGEAALRGTLYCRHHRDVTDWKHRSGLRSQTRPQTHAYDHGTILVPNPKTQVYPPLQLEFPEDRPSIQINIYRITDYLARGLMDRATAATLMYGMQVAQTNLGKTPLFEPAPVGRASHSESGDSDSPATPANPVSRPVHRVILTPDGDEIAPPVEILEDNEAEPIHHKSCPCLECAEKYRNQLPEEHHPNCQCGLCEEQEQEQSTELRAQSSEHRRTQPKRILNGLSS